MPTYLVIEGGKVTNAIEWDGETPHGINGLVVRGEGNVGWKWDGEKAFDPNPTAPHPVVPSATDKVEVDQT